MFDKNNLFVVIDGIDMEFEAWELIRLFFNVDSIHFIHTGDIIEDFVPGSLLSVKVEKEEDTWSCKAFFFPQLTSLGQLKKAQSLEVKPQYFSEKVVTHVELTQPGGNLFKSRKILVGSCIIEILSKVTGIQLPYGSLTGVRPVKLAMQCLKDGLNKPATISQLIRITGMSQQKAGILFDVAEVEKPYVHSDKKKIHLYIGIPFCASRCLYCSFTAYPIQRYKELVPAYLQALEKEIQVVAEWVNRNHFIIASVYIGGGTPTAIDAFSMTQLLTQLNQTFNLENTEFTVEAGRPDTITQDKLEVMRDHHVSRISINPQTMNLETLRLIGRNHTPDDIEEKFYMARRSGFENINMDLIAGLPKEDESMFRYTLDKIEAMAPESLTVHTMAVKRASRLYEEQETFTATSDEIVETMIEDARKSALKMGMRPYYLYRQKNILANLENTGYVKPGLECLYNIHTMEEKQTILALGAGATSKFIFPENKKIQRVYNVKEVTQYIDRIDEMLDRKKKMFEAYER